MKREELEAALPELLEPIGVRVLKQGGFGVLIAEDSDGFRVRLALPMFWSEATVEHGDSPEQLVKSLYEAARTVFHATVKHIARYDRSPVDRLEQIERAAQALIDALDAAGVPPGVVGKAAELAHLIKSKPGSPAWGRTGYGVVEVKP